MSSKKETYLRKQKIQKIRQGICIALMVLCGIYYVTYGRQEAHPELQFESSYSKESGEEMAPSGQQESGRSIEQSENSRSESIPESSISETGGSHEGLESTFNQTKEPEGGAVSSENKGHTGKIDINRASKEELQAIPGVGPSTAENILRYREENGIFMEIAEIQNVKRIGEKTYQKMKDYITVG